MTAPGVTQQGLDAQAPHTVLTSTGTGCCQWRFALLVKIMENFDPYRDLVGLIGQYLFVVFLIPGERGPAVCRKP